MKIPMIEGVAAAFTNTILFDTVRAPLLTMTAFTDCFAHFEIGARKCCHDE